MSDRHGELEIPEKDREKWEARMEREAAEEAARVERENREAARLIQEEERRQSARKRLIGSYLGGAISVWFILREDIIGAEPLTDAMFYFWVGVFAVCFGIASVEQFLTATGRR